MNRDELFAILMKNEKISAEDADFELTFFENDAKTDLAYIREFSHFCKKTVDAFYSKYYHDIHAITRLYIMGLEESGTPSFLHLGFLYTSDAEYYMYFNVYAEALRCIHKVHEMEDKLPAAYISIVLDYEKCIFDACGLKENIAEVTKMMEALLPREDFYGDYRLYLCVNLMECYTLLGNREKAEQYCEACKKILKEEKQGEEWLYLQMMELNTGARLKNDAEPSAEYIDSVRKFCGQISKESEIRADFYKYFPGIFRYVRGFIPDAEILRYLKKIIDAAHYIRDRIMLYRFLFEEFGITEKDEPELYTKYYDDLSVHFTMTTAVQTQEILSEIAVNERMCHYKASAETDTLTGLGNRRAYDIAIQGYIDGHKVPNGICLIAMDLNGLKNVNDDFGHDVGDEYLIAASECMNTAFGAYGKTYRVGGDEFSAVLHLENVEISSLFEQLDDCMDEWSRKRGITLSLSIGYALASEFAEGTDSEEILAKLKKAADERMYESKKAYYEKNGINRRRS